MKKIALFVSVVVLLLATACSSVNESLEKMIPADATGVVSIDVPAILKKAQMLDDGRVVLPADLTAVLDENDAAPLCQAITDLPVMGINADGKAFAFFSEGTFSAALLVPIADEQAALKTLTTRVGKDFEQAEGMSCMAHGDHFFVIHQGVLMAARVGKPAEMAKLAKSARVMYDRKARSILDVDQAKSHIEGDGDINGWFQLKGVKRMLDHSSTYRQLVQRMPLVEIFTESDIEAVTCRVNLNENDAQMVTQFLVADGSDYMRLMNATIAKPDAAVLNVIPGSMEYVVSMSVKGDQLVQLPQIEQLLNAFGKLPYIGRIDLKGMLSTIDGPVAVSMAPDPYLQGDWNAVVAAHSSCPDDVVRTISTFAQALGQAPEMYDGEYVYQYENKMIKVGVRDGVVYFKMLNYDEQNEHSVGDDEALKQLFGSAPVALTVKSTTAQGDARFAYGLTDHVNGQGTFVPAAGEKSATLALLKVLCAIRPAAAYDDMIEPTDDTADDYLPSGVTLQPVR